VYNTPDILYKEDNKNPECGKLSIFVRGKGKVQCKNTEKFLDLWGNK